MEKIDEFNTERNIIESTKLIRKMFDNNFTKRQMDLIYAVISLVKPDDEEFKTYHISYKAIGKIFNPSNPDCSITINDIDKAVKGIVNKSFRMEDDENITYYTYVSKALINKEEKYIEFRLDKDVQQFYLKLQKGEYTSYLLKDLLKLSTIFQANLFRWLSCNSGFENTVSINIENAAMHFYGNDLQGKELIKKIDKALEVINEKTCIQATYEKKRGAHGKIISLEFNITNNYIKPKKIKTESQIKSDSEKNKAMWQENLEMKRRIAELEAQLAKNI